MALDDRQGAHLLGAGLVKSAPCLSLDVLVPPKVAPCFNLTMMGPGVVLSKPCGNSCNEWRSDIRP